MSLCQLLAELRDRSGLSHREVAEACSREGLTVSAASISHYTTGARRPDATALSILLDVWGATNVERAAVWAAYGVPTEDLRHAEASP